MRFLQCSSFTHLYSLNEKGLLFNTEYILTDCKGLNIYFSASNLFDKSFL